MKNILFVFILFLSVSFLPAQVVVEGWDSLKFGDSIPKVEASMTSRKNVVLKSKWESQGFPECEISYTGGTFNGVRLDITTFSFIANHLAHIWLTCDVPVDSILIVYDQLIGLLGAKYGKPTGISEAKEFRTLFYSDKFAKKYPAGNGAYYYRIWQGETELMIGITNNKKIIIWFNDEPSPMSSGG
jgi:hypothetical protein